MEKILDNQLDSYYSDCADTSTMSSVDAAGCPVHSTDISPCLCEEFESPIETRLSCDDQILLGDVGASRVLLKMLNPASSSALTTIHLDSAGLTRVPSELTRFARLENVHLSGNRIQSIDSGTFNFTATLKRLDLSSNGLTRIEPGAFKGQFKLKFINCYWLCSKSLCNITGRYGEGSWIILSRNNLTRFESDVFQSVLELMEPFIDASQPVST